MGSSKKVSILFYAFTALLLAASAAAEESAVDTGGTSAQSKPVLEWWERCSWAEHPSCAEWKLLVYSDGNITYVGIRNAEPIGNSHGVTSLEVVGLIRAAFREFDFFNIPLDASAPVNPRRPRNNFARPYLVDITYRERNAEHTVRYDRSETLSPIHLLLNKLTYIIPPSDGLSCPPGMWLLNLRCKKMMGTTHESATALAVGR